MRRGGKEQSVFAIDQELVVLDQCCRLDEHTELRNPVRIHEQRGQSEHEAIPGVEIRCALPRATIDQKLMFEQERLCCNGAYTTLAEQLRDGD